MTPRLHTLCLAAVAAAAAALAPIQDAAAFVPARPQLPATRTIGQVGGASVIQIARLRGITRTTQLPTQKLRNVRRRMVKGRSTSFADLRQLADIGDGLAAYKLAKRIEGMRDGELLADAIHYYSRAVYSGRESALRPLTRLLKRAPSEMPKARLDSAENALLARAAAGSAKAAAALAKFYKAGRPFGSKPVEALAMMRRSIELGDREAALELALSLLSAGSLTDSVRTEIVGYLELAAITDAPGPRAMAETLLVQLRPQLAEAKQEVKP